VARQRRNDAEFSLVAMLAQLEQGGSNRRDFDRRILKLRLPGATVSEGSVVVLVHDLSLTGLLIETSADLSVGSDFAIDLPESGLRHARVMWNSGQYFGCQFHEPISRGGISAALLRNPVFPELEPSYMLGTEPADGEEDKLPLRTRLWIMIALSLALWTLVLMVFAVI
jgi:hypothetical protein